MSDVATMEIPKIVPFTPSKRKVVIEDSSETVEKLAANHEELLVADLVDPNLAELKKKKKKQLVVTDFLDDENVGPREDANGEQSREDEQGNVITREYKYGELLGRVHNLLRENKTDLAGAGNRTMEIRVMSDVAPMEIPKIVSFTPSKRKVVSEDPSETVEKLAANHEELLVADVVDPNLAELKKKKKKQLVVTDFLDDENVGPKEDANGEQSREDEQGNVITREYKYEELLGRVLNLLRENKTDLAGAGNRTMTRPPLFYIERIGKATFVNFIDLCNMMHRQPNHVMDFFDAELGTRSFLDGQHRLVMKGLFTSRNFYRALWKYFYKYVICNPCRDEDVQLSMKNMLSILRKHAFRRRKAAYQD